MTLMPQGSTEGVFWLHEPASRAFDRETSGQVLFRYGSRATDINWPTVHDFSLIVYSLAPVATGDTYSSAE